MSSNMGKKNYPEKNKINMDNLKKMHKQFIRNNKSILKTQQKFKSERHNVFIEKINKIALSKNNDKRMQSIDSIKTYAYGRSKDLLSEKEDRKQKRNIIQIGCKFLIIHIEY